MMAPDVLADLDRAIQVLFAKLGDLRLDMSAEDLADAFWLAVRRRAPTPRAQELPLLPEPPRPDPVKRQPSPPIVLPPPPPVEEPHEPVAPREPEIVLPEPKLAPSPTTLPIALPTGPGLPRKPRLTRALRPLRRRIPSPTERILDEQATAESWPDDPAQTLRLRPAPERWLDVSVIVEVSDTMGVWKQTIREVCRWLQSTGAFRSVHAWQLFHAQTGLCLCPGLERAEPGAGRSPTELVSANGRRLVLLVTDGISPTWLDGTVARFLEGLLRGNSVTLLNLLPGYLQDQTRLGQLTSARFRARFRAREVVAPNSRLRSDPGGYLSDNNDPQIGVAAEPRSLLALPVTALEPLGLASWAKWLAHDTVSTTGGVFLDLASQPAPANSAGEARPRVTDAKILVDDFWSIASPPARELARYMAASPTFNLPLLRLVRASLLAGVVEQVHEAEFLFSGLLHVLNGGERRISEPEAVIYDFLPGVRDHLIALLPRSKALRLLRLEKVAAYVDAHLGVGPRFSAMLRAPERHAGVLGGSSDTVLQVTRDLVARLGGDFARLTERGAPPVVRLLHLSDFQFRSPQQPNPRLDALSAAIRELVAQGRKPDLVVITGDVTWSGRRAEFANAQRWIEQGLLPALGEFDPRHLVLIPGNHDVDLSRLRRAGMGRLLEGDRTEYSEFDASEEAASLREALAAFQEFCKPYCPIKDILKPDEVVFNFQGWRLRLVRLNSAWVENVPIQSWKWWAQWQQYAAKFDRPTPDETRIVLMHHPYFSQPDATVLNGYLAELRGQLVLHGHSAPLQLAGPKYDAASNLIWVAAGHVGPSAMDQGPFSLIELDLGQSVARCFPRAWSDIQRRWEPFQTGGAEVFALPLPRLVPEREEFHRLPRWGIVAYLARCLRRVLALIPLPAAAPTLAARLKTERLAHRDAFDHREPWMGQPEAGHDPLDVAFILATLDLAEESAALGSTEPALRIPQETFTRLRLRAMHVLRRANIDQSKWLMFWRQCPSRPSLEQLGEDYSVLLAGLVEAANALHTAASTIGARGGRESLARDMLTQVRILTPPSVLMEMFAALHMDFQTLGRIAEESRGSLDRPWSVKDFGNLWPGGEPAWLRTVSEGPIHWVLVAGLGTGKIPSKVEQTSMRLGQMLARQGYGLIGCGWLGVHEIVARSFTITLRALGRSEQAFLKQVVRAGRKPVHAGGERITLRHDAEESQRCCALADAVILISGAGGTYQTGQVARRLGLPVLPLADTGDDAARTYEIMVEKLHTGFSMGQEETETIPGLNYREFLTLGDPAPEVVDRLPDLLEKAIDGFPAFEALGHLARRLRTVFLVRCVRRVFPLLLASWRDAPPIYKALLERMLATAEQADDPGAIGSPQKEEIERHFQQLRDREPDISAARLELTDVRMAALTIARVLKDLIVQFESTASPDEFLLALDACRRVLRLAEKSALITPESGKTCRRMVQRDYRSLYDASEEDTAEDTASINRLTGPLWPEGVPPGWPPLTEDLPPQPPATLRFKNYSMRSGNVRSGPRKGDPRYSWCLFVDEPADILQQIESVEYRLHSSFNNPVRRITDVNHCFAVFSGGWGTFTAQITVRFKDSQERNFTHALELYEDDWPRPGRLLRFTTEQEKQVYDLLFEEGDPWLRVNTLTDKLGLSEETLRDTLQNLDRANQVRRYPFASDDGIERWGATARVGISPRLDDPARGRGPRYEDPPSEAPARPAGDGSFAPDPRLTEGGTDPTSSRPVARVFPPV